MTVVVVNIERLLPLRLGRHGQLLQQVEERSHPLLAVHACAAGCGWFPTTTRFGPNLSAVVAVQSASGMQLDGWVRENGPSWIEQGTDEKERGRRRSSKTPMCACYS